MEHGSLFVAVYLGYPVEGDTPEVMAVFSSREAAEAFVSELTVGYVDPQGYARDHWAITEAPLNPVASREADLV